MLFECQHLLHDCSNPTAYEVRNLKRTSRASVRGRRVWTAQVGGEPDLTEDVRVAGVGTDAGDPWEEELRSGLRGQRRRLPAAHALPTGRAGVPAR